MRYGMQFVPPHCDNRPELPAMTCRIAVPLTSTTPPLADQVRAAQRAGADLVELRVDCIADIDAVESLLRGPREIPLILTIRAASEGGQWDGDDAERIALYERLGLLLPGFIDVELATWQRSANLRQKIGLVCDTEAPGPDAAPSAADPTRRPKNRLILSHHNWRETPADPAAVLAEIAATPAAVAKAVFHARDVRDSLRVLAALRESAARRPTIALCMGAAGLLTRVLARKFGAFLTFAAQRDGAGSAPGQPSIDDLIHRLRWARIGPQTRVYGVVGWPVEHSRSPLLHNLGMGRDNIDGVYLPMPLEADAAAFDAFMDFIAAADWLDLAGLSVTIPHKEHAFRWLRRRDGPISPAATACGAVNTLMAPRSGESPAAWRGENTDGLGALAALAAAGAADVRSADILGAGGAARAIVAALAAAGCRVTIYNRSLPRAAELAAFCGGIARPWEERAAREGEVVINCTPLGMWPQVAESPLPADAFRGVRFAFDTIYNPRVTRFLERAAAVGATPVSGIEMFIAQAAAQYRLWHACEPPLAEWRAALA